jgi:type II secretory pathway component PulK
MTNHARLTATSARRGRRDRGTVLIVTMWVVLVLAGLVLVLTHTMRVEAVASANIRSGLEADATAKGAVEFVKSVLDGTNGATQPLEDIDWEARQVGNGSFWVFRTDLGDDGQYDLGLVDEASRINLNTASSDMLLKLPSMTAELADSIVDWRDGDADVSPSGAESEYYLLQRPAYYCKDAPLETVEEVLLIRGATADLLYGEDANRNGILDANENDGEESPPSDNSDGSLDTGFLHYVTVYSSEPNLAADGSARVSVNDFDTAALSTLLGEVIADDRVFTILQAARRGRPYQSVIQFYEQSGLTSDEFAGIADRLTTSDEEDLTGLVNVNTAPREVLLCLPELDESDVDDLLVGRGDPETDTSSIAWVAALLEPEKAEAVGPFVTTRSYQFSADIVAVSGDGRAYRRYRVILDARQSPPRVLRWQDLTHLGWPLDAGIIDELRAATWER